MPPKKKKDKTAEVELVEYNVNAMNSSELKAYAHMLERDIENMRNYCSFYQKAGDKLGECYRTRLVELKNVEDQILAKDAEMEEVRFNVDRKVRELKDWAAYDEFVNEECKNRQETETWERLEEGTRRHQQEMERLEGMLRDKERELAAQGKKFQMKRNDALQKEAQQVADRGQLDRNLLERSVEGFAGMLEDANHLNRLELESIAADTLEAKRRMEQKFRDSCASYKETLQNYYKEITREDLDSIRKLTNKEKELEADIRAARVRLRTLHAQNEQLRSEGVLHRTPPPRFDSEAERRRRRQAQAKKKRNAKAIENLRAENEALRKDVKLLSEQADNLRRQFTQALYRVRQSAEMKVTFLKQRLEQNQNPATDDDDNEEDESSSYPSIPDTDEGGEKSEVFNEDSS